jgi:regulation of enolase protein 1 (concanavalin A-like superfamily)
MYNLAKTGVMGLVLFLLAGLALAADKSKPKIINGFGEFIDLDQDCRITEDDAHVALTIPGKMHDLRPDQKIMNAPRVVQELTGDFVIQVKLPGALKLDGTALAPNPSALAGAGLIIVLDDKNCVYVERVVNSKANKIISSARCVCYKDGQLAKTETLESKNQDTWLRLERRDKTLTASTSQELGQWTHFKPLTVDLPKKVKVGIFAKNSSSKPFSADFEGLKITGGKVK